MIRYWKKVYYLSITFKPQYKLPPRDIKDILNCSEGSQPCPFKALVSAWSALTLRGYRSLTTSMSQHVAAVIRGKGGTEQDFPFFSGHWENRELKQTVCEYVCVCACTYVWRSHSSCIYYKSASAACFYRTHR